GKEIFTPEARAELTGRRETFDPVDVYRARYAETARADPLARLQDVDFGIYLVDDLLVKTDRASMAWSLEARVPFLDTVVTNFAFSLPTGEKVRRFAKKRLLRKAVEPLLPAQVVHGPKRGFSIPAAAWLRDDVEITTRDYAQTVQLIEQHGMTATVIGHHGGRSRLGKAAQMRRRLRALRKWARHRDFDLALAHGSHELTMTARRLVIPSATTFDYEWAWLQHQLGCRAATRVVVPEWIPPQRLARYTATPPKLQQYPGLKEEYYLTDFEPDESVLQAWSINPARVLVVLRPPPD